MDSVGLLVVVVVLVIGIALGLWHRRTDGRLHSVGPPGDDAGHPTAADRGHAEYRAVTPDAEEPPGVIVGLARASGPRGPGERLDPALLASLGVRPGPVTLLQFSSAFCAPCRAVRRVSAEVAGMLRGVRHVEVDAESHLDAVRALGIWRTPTLLVLDVDCRVVKRATGVPAKPQLIAVLGELLPAG